MPLLLDGDDSSDESESVETSGDEERNNNTVSSSDEETESGDDGDLSGSESAAQSATDSDDDDSEEGSVSDAASSGSESDDSPEMAMKTKTKAIDENEANDEEKEEEEDDVRGSALCRIQQISSKLSFLLDDLHRTFKPKAVPRIAPDSVFPQYPYRSLPTDSPKRLWRNRKEDTISLPPISINSPRCDGHCETGGEFVFPEYAAPPTEREIKELYGNRTDSERQNKSRRFRRDSAWEYETGNFSEEFITASNRRAEGDGSSDDAKRGDSDGDGDDTAPNDADPPIPSTFEALHERFEAERRCIEQRQNKIQRMRKKLWWFRKNNTGGPTVNVAEIEPLKGVLPQNTPSLSVRERERNLLNKAAEVLLGGGATARAKTRDAASDGEEASPDSLQIESLV